MPEQFKSPISGLSRQRVSSNTGGKTTVSREKLGHEREMSVVAHKTGANQNAYPIDKDRLESEASKHGLTKPELPEQTNFTQQKQVDDNMANSEQRNYNSRNSFREPASQSDRENQYEDFKDRVGEIVSGTVQDIRFGNIIVDLGTAEGHIRRTDTISRDNLQPGDTVKAYLYKISQEEKGPQIFLSRAAPEFMIKLFSLEVPEIGKNIIEIKACVRDPGNRAKIGVVSHDDSVDPIGTCIGTRGGRVRAVAKELAGEKIDIVTWSDDHPTFVENALKPAKVEKVVFNEAYRKFEVLVSDDQFPLAIGKRGQNVRLASQLTGWKIDLISSSDFPERSRGQSSDKESN